MKASERHDLPAVAQHPRHRRFAASTVSLALLDRAGMIVSVNQVWTDFARDNGGYLARTGVGMNYLEVCEAAGDDPLAQQVSDAIRSAIQGALPAPISVRIPCSPPEQERWFDELISSRYTDDGECIGATVTLSPSERVPVAPYRATDEMLDHAVSRLTDAQALLAGLAERLPGPVDKLTLTATSENLEAVIRVLRPRQHWRHR